MLQHLRRVPDAGVDGLISCCLRDQPGAGRDARRVEVVMVTERWAQGKRRASDGRRGMWKVTRTVCQSDSRANKIRMNRNF
jgi:hypothetical protein